MNLEQQIYDKFGEVWLQVGNEYKVTCPTCNHKSLWINVDKMCFVCFACIPMSSGHLSSLLQIPTSVKMQMKMEALKYEPDVVQESLEANALPRGYRRVVGAPDFPRGWDYIKSRGVEPAEVEFGRYDDMHVCFPMREDGKVVYWQARSISKFLKRKTDNPYNDRKTRGKSTVVYGIDELKKGHPAIVVEGVFDKLRSGGVATLGKSPSEDQVQKILKKKPSVIVFCYDGDAFEASKRGAKLVRTMSRNQPALAVPLPPDKDPADLGREALVELIIAELSYDVMCQTTLLLTGSSVAQIEKQLRG